MKKEEVYIGIFGKRNQGKSSLMNLLAGQNISIVSDTPGTTTDPVKKSCEIFGIGKCVFVDTAGFDEQVQADGLGKMRVEKTFDYVQRLDMAILLISENSLAQAEK
ncbi:MAG: 50S ribosome-binding GTPase, partial [Bacteroidales bacterium]|nr:50S ribosome-binding GTPase [Bacteroidales bacterium]